MTTIVGGSSSEGALPAPFEFVLGGPAVSQQARLRQRRERWRQRVRSAARDRWTAESPATGPVAVTITYFFTEAPLDVDNIPKPILDALKELVYSDDDQVFDLLCRKRDLRDDPRIQNPSPDLLDCLRESKEVVHVLLEASKPEVEF